MRAFITGLLADTVSGLLRWGDNRNIYLMDWEPKKTSDEIILDHLEVGHTFKENGNIVYVRVYPFSIKDLSELIDFEDEWADGPEQD